MWVKKCPLFNGQPLSNSYCRKKVGESGGRGFESGCRNSIKTSFISFCNWRQSWNTAVLALSGHSSTSLHESQYLTLRSYMHRVKYCTEWSTAMQRVKYCKFLRQSRNLECTAYNKRLIRIKLDEDVDLKNQLQNKLPLTSGSEGTKPSTYVKKGKNYTSCAVSSHVY